MKPLRVRITLEVDVEFIRSLQLNVQMQNLLRENPPRMTPMMVMAVVALGEFRGGLEAEIHARTPVEWRPHIDVVHEERRWQDETGAWHKTGGELMDPDEALKNAREAMAKLLKQRDNNSETEKLLEAFEALDGWLSKGGFLPKDWAKGR